jgi:hypothetical protein
MFQMPRCRGRLRLRRWKARQGPKVGSTFIIKIKKLTNDRQMSKLSKETDVLYQHNTEVTEALRRIRLDTHLSTDDMRAAIDEVLAMVSA